MPASFVATLGGSPEDAAKLFIRAASDGLARVVADGLAQALQSIAGATVPPPDWTKYIKGVAIELSWETPGTSPSQGLLLATPDPAVGSGGSALGGFGVSVSGTWTF